MYGKNRFVYHASLHLNTVPNQLCLPWTPVLHLRRTLIKLMSISHRNQGKLPLKTAFYKMYYWNEEINSLGIEQSHTKKNTSTVRQSKTITTICEPARGILYTHLSLGTSFTFFILTLRENNGGKHWEIGGKCKTLRASTSLFLSRLNILYNLV